MPRTFLALLASCLLAACAVQDKSENPVASVASVDLKRYAGTWYEIGSFPMFFQRNCIANTQANYTIEADGSVGNPARRNLWILSRTKRLQADQLDKALSAAKQQGFDLAQLHYTRQE